MKKLNVKGEFDYDYANGFVVGIQIFEASEFLRIDKLKLRQIRRWRFDSNVDKGRIEIRVVFETIYRNKPVIHEPIIAQPAPENLPESMVVCTV